VISDALKRFLPYPAMIHRLLSQKNDCNFTVKYFNINGKKFTFAVQFSKIDKKQQEK